MKIVYNWVNEFKRGHTSTKDEHPVEVTTPEMIDKIHDIVLSDQRIKEREIVEATGISQGTVFSILHEKYGVKKIFAQWVPHLLFEENKRNRMVGFEAILAFFLCNTDKIRVDTQLWTKHESTTTLQRQRNSQNNEFLKANGLRRRRRW